MRQGYRQGRVGEEIKKVISELLLKEIKDPRLDRMISITSVDVSPDLTYALIFVTVLTGKETPKEEREEIEDEVLAGFDSCTGLIRKEIGKKIKLRRVPDLAFKIDNSMEYGSHMDEMLRELGLE